MPTNITLTTAEKRVGRLWNRMTFEVELMSTRISWLISSQAFLFAAFFIGLARLDDGVIYAKLLIFGIPAIGLMICCVVGIYIHAANQIVAICRKEFYATKAKFPNELQDCVDENHHALSGRQNAQTATNILVVMFAAF